MPRGAHADVLCVSHPRCVSFSELARGVEEKDMCYSVSVDSTPGLFGDDVRHEGSSK